MTRRMMGAESGRVKRRSCDVLLPEPVRAAERAITEARSSPATAGSAATAADWGMSSATTSLSAAGDVGNGSAAGDSALGATASPFGPTAAASNGSCGCSG